MASVAVTSRAIKVQVEMDIGKLFDKTRKYVRAPDKQVVGRSQQEK
jgi:hypothetical protein